MTSQVADAVVVGAGPNGLVAANLLADAGWDVAVLEAAAAPGGAVRSAELTLPGYTHDLYSAFYPLAGDFSPLGQLGLTEHGLVWRRAPATLAHIWPDGRAAVLGRDVAATAASVERFAAGDGARWRHTYQQWRRVGPDLLRLVLSPFPPIRPAAALLRHAGLGDALRLARRMVMPAAGLGQELFRGEGARLLLAGSAMHTDLAPTSATSGGYGWLLAMLAQQHGFPVPEGGAGRLTDALVTRLRRAGGLLRCDASVRRIVTRGGRVIGVRTADGGAWRARRAVIADVSAPALYRNLLDPAQLPPRLLADLAEFQYDGATVKVDWALAGRVPWLDPAVSGVGTIHLGVDGPGLGRVGAALSLARVPARPFLVGGQMTTADPSRSPAGTEVLWAYTHLPYRPHWDRAQIMAVVARMEAAIEAVAPGFGSLVLARHVAGPAELEAANANLHGGAIGGGTSAPHQQLVLRPFPGLGRADTVIDGLYLASSSAHPGGGVHGAAGANAARAALARRAPVAGQAYGMLIRSANRRLYGSPRPARFDGTRAGNGRL